MAAKGRKERKGPEGSMRKAEKQEKRKKGINHASPASNSDAFWGHSFPCFKRRLKILSLHAPNYPNALSFTAQ